MVVLEAKDYDGDTIVVDGKLELCNTTKDWEEYTNPDHLLIHPKDPQRDAKANVFATIAAEMWKASDSSVVDLIFGSLVKEDKNERTEKHISTR